MYKMASNGFVKQFISIGLPGILLTITFVIVSFFYLIPSYQESTMELKQDLVKNQVKTLISAFEYYRAMAAAGEISENEAKERSAALVRNIRYGQYDEDYFWINAMDGTMIAHPYRSDLEGRNMLELEDISQRKIFQKFIDICKKDKAGFATYIWQKNDKEEDLQEKISFIELYEPWDWILGSGIYFQDIEAEVNNIEASFIKITAISFLALLIYILFISAKNYRLENMKNEAYTKLRSQEQYFRRIIYTLSEGLVVIDRSGKIVFFNNFLEEQIGQTASDTAGKNIESVLTLRKLDTHEAIELQYSVLPPGGMMYLNAELEDKYARRHVFKVILNCIAMEDTKEEFIVIIIQENTKLYDTLALYKQQQKDLDRLVAERTRSLEKAIEDLSLANKAIDSAASAIVVTDSNGVVISANKATQALSGVPLDEIIGNPYPLFDSSQCTVLSSKESMDAVKSGRIWHGEVSRPGRDGSTIIEDVTITPITSDTNEVSHFISIEHDSSERRRETEFLLRLQAAFDQSLDGVFILNTDGVVDFANNACAAMHGYDKEELVGKPLSFFFSEEVFEAEVAPRINKLFTKGEISFEVRQLHSSGREFPSLSSAKIIQDTDGNPISALFIVRDITEKQRLEMELRQAQKLESIGQLAAGIAHEINTPIQFIGDSVHYLNDSSKELFSMIEEYEAIFEKESHCELSQELGKRLSEAREKNDVDFHREELPKALERIHRGVDRVSKIVRAMKELAHPDSSEMEESDINQLVETSTTVATNEYKYVADLALDLKPLPTIKCKPGEINQVLINIIVNAAHTIKDKIKQNDGGRGKITVSTSSDEDSVIIKISDTGCGIPEKIKERIFDPFFTTKDVGVGSGQGLAISRSIIVDKHHGSLTFETEIGVGTTFIIRLPIGDGGKEAQ